MEGGGTGRKSWGGGTGIKHQGSTSKGPGINYINDDIPRPSMDVEWTFDGARSVAVKSRAVVIVVLLLSLSAWVYIYVREDDDDHGKPGKDNLGFAYENIQVQGSPQNTNEPHIAINPRNPLNIVVGANDYSTPNNDAWCGHYSSMDGGRTWEIGLIPGYNGDPRISPLTGYSGTGDPVLAFDSSGNLYYAGIAFQRTFVGRSAIFVAKSTDGGRTWPPSLIRIVAQGDGLTTFHDKEWMTVDPDTGFIYIAWASFHLLTGATILFARSTDGGNTWSFWDIVSDLQGGQLSNQGTFLATDSHGTIHLVWIDFDRNEIQYVFSGDQGGSFSLPVSIAPVNPIPYTLNNNTYRTPTLPQLAIDPGNGRYRDSIYITWNDWSGTDADILMIHSRDLGKTWSQPVRVNRDSEGNGKDQFFHGLSVAPGGEVSLNFYDRRDCPDNTMLHVYHAISRDGGQTFRDHRLTDTPFNGEAGGGSLIGQQIGGDAFIGDYHASVALEDKVYFVWCDTRNGLPNARNSDIYLAYVNL